MAFSTPLTKRSPSLFGTKTAFPKIINSGRQIKTLNTATKKVKTKGCTPEPMDLNKTLLQAARNVNANIHETPTKLLLIVPIDSWLR